MFQDLHGRGGVGLRIRGTQGSLLWGYRTAATFRKWSIAKVKGKWMLRATLERVDAFQCRQTPLLFAAPRHGGFWAWPLESLQLGPDRLVATLGPPEQ